ncbi:MAG: hypothetical protein WBN57_07690 [Gammaproteobacteria bacterium]
MKTVSKLSLVAAVSAVLSACGGSGSGSSSFLPGTAGFTITGTVPGTLIEAFCDDGSYHVVASTKNATGRHPFELELPDSLACRIVMITNEDDPADKVVTPIKMIKQNGQSGIAISAKGELIDLGHVNLAMNRLEMLKDANGDGVEDVPREVILDDDASGVIEIHNGGNDALDKDNDGIIEVYEDDDGDGISNHDDDDDDDDGIRDELDDRDDDFDDDGITNDKDVDDDNDGIEDEADSDDDNDGIDDETDSDDDNDGISDDQEDEDSGEDSDGEGDGEADDDGDEGDEGGVVTPVDPGEPTPGRLLASQCAQCHGTDGRSVSDIDSLLGEGSELAEEMLEMKHSTDRDDIMNLQAAGYTDEQIQQISDYFASLPGGND